ncbi:hypothetical protein ABFV83_08810 [Lacrimispora sp. BS-2]|uniref:Uncharacterized protein n=1 Tax=Lacrimispora sp. BS-2 TaxID=3151850 RepID=A0AAU7PUJ5_9FIRM
MKVKKTASSWAINKTGTVDITKTYIGTSKERHIVKWRDSNDEEKKQHLCWNWNILNTYSCDSS